MGSLTICGARHSEDALSTVALFLDAVLLRHHTRPSRSFAEALAAAADDLHDALRHNGTPLLDLSRLLPGMGRVFGLSQSLAFEVLPPVTGLRLDGCSMRRTDQLHEHVDGRSAAAVMFMAPPTESVMRTAACGAICAMDVSNRRS
ncbi:hypothetical protein [Actinacidiphila oryziradicis]|uniref:Uncharacterized protein n=1 Tax=Actinacidiphila oryziradicis TaxID=2571141 RepID=A0A4U0S6N8_9ACTN|nr:hypothetical protein [Actinacidiphila oryziradicis]TKA04766.1 hypothetical protein FCI23_34470 [Actinacidiphila oryziradicis]